MGITGTHPLHYSIDHCTADHPIIRVTVSYDGTQFAGWQVQPKQRTVQGVIEKTLSSFAKRKIIIHGSGRTDSGVHGLGQVFHFMGPFPIPLDRFVPAVNAWLPGDICILKAELAEPGFHARYNAKKKTYRYRILNQKNRDPMQSNYVWHIERSLNIDAMAAACKVLEGTHDFLAFSATGSPRKNTVRTLETIQFHADQGHIDMEFTADGFLYHMVRNLVGTIVDVGKGRFSPECVREILESKDRGKAGKTAPASGLYLIHVEY